MALCGKICKHCRFFYKHCKKFYKHCRFFPIPSVTFMRGESAF